MRRQSPQNYVRGRVGRYLHAARSGHMHIRVPVAARSGRTQLRVLTAGRSGQVHARALTAARSVDTNSRLLTAARPVQTHSPVLTAPGFNHARIRTLVAVIAALTIALTACAGVPERSTPERVRAIGGSTATPVPTPTPQPGADPRAIVLGFLS